MGQSTRVISVGGLRIGGGAPISVQSMTNTDTRDVDATLIQIRALRTAGCHIVRLSVYDAQCVDALKKIKKMTDVPLVADIHFDFRLAVGSIEAGVDKLRINPGNIGGRDRVMEVVRAARDRGVPIRIGVNGGSLEKDILHRFGGTTPEAMVESALGHVAILESCGFFDTAISVKHSSVVRTVEAYRLLSTKVAYPLHLGVTETGTVRLGVVKSAVGIGSLLLDGIGDTIRVSLSGDPVREVVAGYDILRACGLYNTGVEIISCPTCGRCGTDVEGIALKLETMVSHIRAPLKVAVMGCIVNGPGEAKEADIGIAGTGSDVILFKKGERVERIPTNEALERLVAELNEMDRIYAAGGTQSVGTQQPEHRH
jgi:(E)-4-hydroxy-3-methylbut-2-enyl-diphosphate synthase